MAIQINILDRCLEVLDDYCQINQTLRIAGHHYVCNIALWWFWIQWLKTNSSSYSRYHPQGGLIGATWPPGFGRKLLPRWRCRIPYCPRIHRIHENPSRQSVDSVEVKTSSPSDNACKYRIKRPLWSRPDLWLHRCIGSSWLLAMLSRSPRLATAISLR